jgi:hypothetical protein
VRGARAPLRRAAACQDSLVASTQPHAHRPRLRNHGRRGSSIPAVAVRPATASGLQALDDLEGQVQQLANMSRSHQSNQGCMG